MRSPRECSFRLAVSAFVLAGLASVGLAVPNSDDPPPPKDGPLPWKVPAFLKQRWHDGTLGWVAEDFTPWDAVEGRDGNYYGRVGATGLAAGGSVYALSPQGVARSVYRFPVRRLADGGYQMGAWLKAHSPRGRVAVGQDGAIYGRALEGGVFNSGVIYKVDAFGRFQVLHHLEKSAFDGDVMVATNGDVYAALGSSSYWDPAPSWLLRLSKDGQYHYIPLGSNQAVAAVVETVNHEIVMLSQTMPQSPAAAPGSEPAAMDAGAELRRLNAQHQPEWLATLGSVPRLLVPLENGNLLCATDAQIVEVSMAGEVSEVHAFNASEEGTHPNFLTVAQDGSYLGSTAAGGMNGTGTWFRLGPGTNGLTILGHLPAINGSLTVATWMAEVFPLRVAAEAGNLPPTAKDDVVTAGAVKPVGGSLPQTVIRVLSNDRDRDRDSLSIESVGPARHGTIVLDQTKGTITYTAASATVREDRFSYTVTDGKGGRATAQVAIRGNPAGRYQGPARATNGANPGEVIGWFVLNVSKARTISGSLLLVEKAYPFTARFNEFNQAAALPFPGREKLLGGIQLTLREKADGVVVVHAVYQRAQASQSPAEYVAECELVP